MGTRITSKGQVTIPVDIRQAARAATGTELEWTYDPVGQRIIATKATARARQRRGRFAALRGTAGTGMSTDEIMALTRDPHET
jgi:bifunctional DNA-binding transcriptional regulator/antitoxin component of YhaV-PrlF toxin-antitoxin module